MKCINDSLLLSKYNFAVAVKDFLFNLFLDRWRSCNSFCGHLFNLSSSVNLQIVFVHIHTSIHFLYLFNPQNPQLSWEREMVHPGQVARPSQGHIEINKTHNHAHSYSLLGTIKSHQLTSTFLDGGRKPEDTPNQKMFKAITV